MKRKTYITVTLRSQTHEILSSLKERLDVPIILLIHEGALMLQAKYAADPPPAAAPLRRATDRTPVATTAA